MAKQETNSSVANRDTQRHDETKREKEMIDSIAVILWTIEIGLILYIAWRVTQDYKTKE